MKCGGCSLDPFRCLVDRYGGRSGGLAPGYFASALLRRRVLFVSLRFDVRNLLLDENDVLIFSFVPGGRMKVNGGM